MKKINKNILVLRETRDNETRVSITPFEVKTLAKLGSKIFVQKNAGRNSGYSDIDYEINGAEITDDRSNSFYQNIDIVLQVKRPAKNIEAEIVSNLPSQSLIVGFLNPLISNTNHIQLDQVYKNLKNTVILATSINIRSPKWDVSYFISFKKLLS